MTLQEIKTQVYATFPGRAKDYVNGWVKANHGDLRRKDTWQKALNDRCWSEVETATEPTTRITQEMIDSAAEMLYNLPDLIKATPVPDSVSEPSQPRIDPVDVAIAEDMLRKLPQRQIKPNVFIVGSVEGAKPLAA